MSDRYALDIHSRVIQPDRPVWLGLCTPTFDFGFCFLYCFDPLPLDPLLFFDLWLRTTLLHCCCDWIDLWFRPTACDPVYELDCLYPNCLLELFMNCHISIGLLAQLLSAPAIPVFVRPCLRKIKTPFSSSWCLHLVPHLSVLTSRFVLYTQGWGVIMGKMAERQKEGWTQKIQ